MGRPDVQPIRKLESDLLVPDRTIVMVGLMGAGKTAIGKRLAEELALPFYDSDWEISRAADMTIPEIFATYGEAEFRELERRVIARILDGPVCVLALGGGAFIGEETRQVVQQNGHSIWLCAELDILEERVMRRQGTRPLLDRSDNPRETLRQLMDERYPIYALADVMVHSSNDPIHVVLERTIEALRHHLEH